MVSWSAVAGMAAVALGMALLPGPNMLYLASRSIAQGRRAGAVSLAGVAVGFVVYLVAAVAGLAAVFSLVPALYVALKLIGAGYLLHLAWQAIRPGGRSPFATRSLPRASHRRLFTMGLVTNLLNPKIAILYVSLGPQFVDPGRGSVAGQSLVLGLVQVVVAVTVNGAVMLAAASLSGLLARRPVWIRVQRLVMGTVLGGFAVRLALDPSRV